MSPLARCPSASMTNPDASTARSVSRFGRQPPESQTQNRSILSCTRAFHGGIEPDDPNALAVEGQVPPGPAPHVEREPTCARDEPPSPPVEPQQLVQRADRIVEPGDLLEAAHRSGRREHDEGARVVVKEVPAADGL